jgi:phage-related minor tail protein
LANNQKEIKVSYKLVNQDFNKGITEINSDVKTLNKEFKLQSEQMKNTASDTDKLEASLSNLEKQLELAADKTTQTAKALENAKTMMGENSTEAKSWNDKLLDAKRSEEYLKNAIDDTNKKLQASKSDLNAAETEMDQLGNTAKETGDKVEKMGDRIKNAADGAEKAGQVLSVGLTAPVVAVATAATELATSYEEAMNKIQANTGASNKEMEEFKGIAEDIYQAGYGETYDDIAMAIAEVDEQLSGLQPDELEAITKKAIILEETMGMDMTETLRGVNSLMQTYGITAEEAFDYITVGAQNGLNKTDELGDNLAEYATLFEENGYSADEMFAILQAGLDGGAYNLDKVNDLVKEFGIRIGDGTIKTAVEELGGSWKDIYETWEASGESNDVLFQKMAQNLAGIEDPQARQLALTEIWGSLGEDAGYKVVEAMGQVGDSYEEVAGATDTVVSAFETAFGTERTAMLRDLADSFMPVGEGIIDMIGEAQPFLEDFSGYVTDIIDGFNALPDSSQNFILGVGAIGLSVGPALFILGSFVGSITALIDGAMLMAELFPGLVSFAFGPWGLAIAAAIGLGVLIMTHWDEIKVAAAEDWAEIQTLLGVAGDKISEQWATDVADLQAIWGTLKAAASSDWAEIETILSGAGSRISTQWANDKQDLVNIWNNISSSATTTWNAITSTIGGAKDKIGGFVEGIKSFFSNMKLKIPEISLPSLPKISLNTASKTILGKTFTYPTGFSFYAAGGIMDGATLFGMNGGNMMIGGEAGKEAILPLNKKVLGDIGLGIVSANNQLMDALSSRDAVQASTVNINVYATVNSDYDVDRMTDRIDANLAKKNNEVLFGRGRRQ